MARCHIIIIGGGIGGLCCGLLLLHAGYQVSIYEKCPQVGGVIQSIPSAPSYADYDSFASIGIHPYAYRQIFTDIGLDWKNYFSEIHLDELYRVFYEDGSSFTLKKDGLSYPSDFEAFYNESFSNYNAFIKEFYHKYLTAHALILSQPLTHINDIMTLDKLSALIKLNPLTSASSAIKRRFTNPKLQDFLLFQSYYMGFPTSHISQLYATIPACTQTLGLIHIKGGMGAYVKALQKAFIDCKGQLYCNAPIKRILTNHNQAYGVLTESGQMKKANIVVSNADYHFTITKLLNRFARLHKPLLPFQMTCSVFMLRLTLSINLPKLSTHNIYHIQDTENTFSAIADGTMPLKFPMYIYYPSCVDDTFNVSGATTLNIMVRVPNLSFNTSYWSASTIERMRYICLKHLADLLGINSILPYIIHESISTPRDLQEKFNYYQGGAFGLAPSILQNAWLRPQPACSFIKNLYFTGTSIHPGNGISIVMEGAKIVSKLIQSNYPL
ncbi:MAG: phytoene desaturase family protein [Cellulosilyticum sp.]|nr:phytoene desaturase family protein [Cellulosilyticum sp.]